MTSLTRRRRFQVCFKYLFYKLLHTLAGLSSKSFELRMIFLFNVKRKALGAVLRFHALKYCTEIKNLLHSP